MTESLREAPPVAVPQSGPVGKNINRTDAVDKVRGRSVYAGDMSFPGMLYAGYLRSSVPHAYISVLDASAARAIGGVHAVLTAADIPGENRVGIIIKDEPVLADGKVRRVGDPVAVVVAETPALVEKALQAIRVEYRELPAVFDPPEALAAGSPRVHEGGNLLARCRIVRGDARAAMVRADVVVRDTYRTPMVTHVPLEPEAGVARWDGNGIILWVSTQNPHYDRAEVARILGLAQHRVRVIRATTGGGFGGKLDISVQGVLALAAMVTGRPVKMVYSREEAVIATAKRHSFVMHYETGARRDGRLVAVRAKIVGDTGAYASYGPGVTTRVAIHAAGPYAVPNVEVEALCVYTNNPTAGAMRGFGTPAVSFACETQMNRLAAALGMHPLALRYVNALRPGDATATGQVLRSSVGGRETIRRGGLPRKRGGQTWASGGGGALLLCSTGSGTRACPIRQGLSLTSWRTGRPWSWWGAPT